MSTENKEPDFANGAEMTYPLFGIDGLPQYITKLSIAADSNDAIEISCTFLVEKKTLASMERAWEPMFAKYRLVKVEDGPGVPA